MPILLSWGFTRGPSGETVMTDDPRLQSEESDDIKLLAGVLALVCVSLVATAVLL
jgi:hypothetical protein